MIKKNPKILYKIVNRNFSFGDLDKKLEGVSSSTGNIYCPFHENTSSPAAKVYYDDENEWFIIHCFTESKRFTAYDYVAKIMCIQKQLYKNVEEFLEHKLGKASLESEYKQYEANYDLLEETAIQQKIDYINYVYNECDNIVDYIERLYTAE